MTGTARNPQTGETGNVAYGTLDMQHGSKWPEAEAQIRGITAQHGDVMMWLFDFVCTPNQIDTAQEYVQHAYTLIEELCPDLNPNRIVLGIATKDVERPAKRVMMGIAARLSPEAILSTIDFSTERTFLWVGGKLQQ